MFEPFTIALRGLALGFVIALAMGMWGLAGRPRLAFCALLACVAGYLVRSAPEVTGWPRPALMPLSIAAVLFPAALWWLVHAAFDDRADVPRAVWIAMLGLVAVVVVPRDAPSWITQGVGALQKLIGLALAGAALWRLWRGRVDDLVPGRRALRGGLLGYAGAHGVGVLVVELWMGPRRPAAWLDMVNVSLITLVLAVSLALMLRVRQQAVDALFGGVPVPAEDASAAIDEPEPAHAAEAGALAKLGHLMSVERAYRSPELSLAELARRCGLPEYRLRDLIHRRLGFRNFPAFVNDHRVREVEDRLANPAEDRLPILTIAMDAGFGSIGPFNRLFRERYGMTPSAYRQRRGGDRSTQLSED